MTSLSSKQTALIVMDFQKEVVAMFAEKCATAVERAAHAIATARAANVPVIYVVVGFRAGYPEINPRSATFARVAKNNLCINPSADDVAAALRPNADELVVVKRRVSAFSGSDFEVVLRAKGITTLVLAGIATSGVVLSTVRHAADADYNLVVLADACADRDDEVHRVLTEKVFPHQAQVINTAELHFSIG
jgi:nicotinamidase-related amidase